MENFPTLTVWEQTPDEFAEVVLTLGDRELGRTVGGPGFFDGVIEWSRKLLQREICS